MLIVYQTLVYLTIPLISCIVIKEVRVAKPKWHAIVTIVPVLYLAVVSVNLWSARTVTEMAAIVFLGVLVDVDHLSWLRVKKILRHDLTPVPYHVNYLHSWLGAIVVTAFCLKMGFYLAFAMYAAHMFVDGCNRDNTRSGPVGISPIPTWIYQFCPEWAKYGKS